MENPETCPECGEALTFVKDEPVDGVDRGTGASVRLASRIYECAEHGYWRDTAGQWTRVGRLCPLCWTIATFARVGNDDAYDVTCPTCVQYRIWGPVIAELVQDRRTGKEATLQLAAELSREAARTRADGGNLEITAPFWIARRTPH